MTARDRILLGGDHLGPNAWQALPAEQAMARADVMIEDYVRAGFRKIHLDCRGSGAPIVVLIHGLDTAGALSWSAAHDSIAQTTRACAYSRAGIMWSDPTPAFTPIGMVDDLHAAVMSLPIR